MSNPEYILTLSCLDQRGIVHRVSGFLAEHGCNIIDSAQFGDSESSCSSCVHFAREDRDVSDELLRADFGLLAAEMKLDWECATRTTSRA
jgi:formyltetrahydrofolate deformylase